ncbi:MAG: polysaccharide biosynthesis protein PslH [Actinomycetota bacterium]|nr:polysaccharide biosynthesis protein PslH [Actinomycetota bacterium]
MAGADRAGTPPRRRALVVTPWFPYPQDNGSRQRLWALIGGLHERFDIDLVALVDEPVPEQHVEGARARCGRIEVVVRRPFHPRSARAIAAFFHRYPRAVVAQYTPEMRAAVDRLVGEHSYDIVVVSQIHVARYVEHLVHHARLLDDFELAVIRDVDPNTSVPARLRQLLTWTKQRWYARHVVRSFDACVVVSEEERAAVNDVAPDTWVAVVPNGVDLETNTLRHDDVEPDTIIHAGPIAFYANREAVDWFAQQVLPAVRATRPDARLLVTGRTGSAGDLPEGPGVEYTGYIEDIRPAIGAAWLSVVPLRRGGGTRLKILESLALGTPVVSTSKGVEGLGLVAGREVLVADTASDFARATVGLLRDPDARAELRAAGRSAVETRYGWGPIVASFVDLVEELIRRRETPPGKA